MRFSFSFQTTITRDIQNYNFLSTLLLTTRRRVIKKRKKKKRTSINNQMESYPKKEKRKKEESYQKCSRIHTKIINSLGWNKDFQWLAIFYILLLAKN